jgi:ATP-dependent DNA ligase
VLGVDGIADFNALHSRKHNAEVQLYAFDILALDGEDLRGLPLSMRKTNLARLLARRPDGIFIAPFEQGEIGPYLFRAACTMGLEGMVSKRSVRPYRAGPSRDWIKVKIVVARATRSSRGSFLRRSSMNLRYHGQALLGARYVYLSPQFALVSEKLFFSDTSLRQIGL